MCIRDSAGTGKTVRVAVFASGEKADQAKAAGADIVGMEELAAQIKGGDMPFDIVIASPDTMRIVGTLGQILGCLLYTSIPSGSMTVKRLLTLSTPASIHSFGNSAQLKTA